MAEQLAGLRLALVGPLPPPNGGMAMQTRQLALYLEAEGAAVRMIAVNPPYKPQWIRKLRGVRALFRLIPYLITLWRAAGDAELFHVMANSGWSWHLFAAPAIWIAALRGKPVLLNYRGGAAAGFLQREIRWVAPSLRRASRIVVPSGYLRDIFQRHGFSAEVVPNIVDTGLFQPPEGHAGTGGKGPRLLVARHLEALYDVATAIRAFGLLRSDFPDAELVVAGSGPQLGFLRELADGLGIGTAVHFTGDLERDQMAERYRSADILLNPSLEDNMPNSLLEAMASGLAIVSTDAGGIPFMIVNEANGLLVAKGDAVGMSQAARRILLDAGLRSRLTAKGLEMAACHAWAAVRPFWLGIYAALRYSGPLESR